MDRTPVSPPHVTRDTEAKDKFVLTLTVPESRIPERIKAQAAYSIANSNGCVPMDHSRALGGVRPLAMEKLDLVVTIAGKSQFRADAIREPFLAEDYYGLGECRWKISWVADLTTKCNALMQHRTLAVVFYSRVLSLAGH